MGTNCAPLVADLFLICNEGDFMISLSDYKQAFRYLDDILNINNVILSNIPFKTKILLIPMPHF